MCLTTEPTRPATEARAKQAFGFLDGFGGKLDSYDQESHRSLLAYLFPDPFLEVELDWREGAVFVLVGAPVNGRRPEGYYVSPRGDTVRWHLPGRLTPAPADTWRRSCSTAASTPSHTRTRV